MVYSTCSVHPLENEIVVAAVLASPVVRERGWVLARALEKWPCRGLPLPGVLDADDRCACPANHGRDPAHSLLSAVCSESLSSSSPQPPRSRSPFTTSAKLVRTGPDLLTNGFFVSRFERRTATGAAAGTGADTIHVDGTRVRGGGRNRTSKAR